MGIKYAVNENFFKKWSPEMAYVLGYLYADGSLEDASYIRGKYIRVSSVDKRNITKIKKWINSKHNIVEYPPPTKNSQKKYLLRIGSHILYDDLTRLGLYPNKSLTIKFPNCIPKKFLNHFIRGYFDGDGCIHLWQSKGKTQDLILRKLCVTFTCGNYAFLKKLATCLKNNLNTRQINVYNGHRSFMLSYSTGDSVKVFKFLYSNINTPIYFERKFKIFENYFKLRPQRVDRKVKNILQCLGHVVK